MKTKKLTKAIRALSINAFIGVTMTVDKDHPFAFYVTDDEERMQSLDTLYDDLEDTTIIQLLELYESKGVTDIVIIRSW